MKTIDVVFNTNQNDFSGPAKYTSKAYAYFVTDEQARQIVDDKIEFAVVIAPGDGGQLKVVKIVGEPSDTPEKATRAIVSLVDLKAYNEAKAKIDAAKQLRKRIDQRAAELAEQARLAALAEATKDPTLAAMLEELKTLGV